MSPIEQTRKGDHGAMPLTDSFGRRIEYLRVSVTDRCNYRCFYCMPESGVDLGRHRESLTVEEAARVVGLFSELGVRRVRLTGGEPLIRRDVVALVGMLGGCAGLEDLSLSTNGHLLERFAAPLKKAGLDRVNVSLDSIDSEKFARITRGGDLEAVLRGIDAALEAGLRPVKLNMVVMRGINDGEIEPMLAFAVRRGVELRFIETMPVGMAGIEGMAYYVPAGEILERVQNASGADLVPLEGNPRAGPARYYQIGAGPARVGVISAMSRHFCEGCNRVRLTTRGELVLCLGQNDRVGLRGALREGISDETLKQIILDAIRRKPERHEFLEGRVNQDLPGMSVIGG